MFDSSITQAVHTIDRTGKIEGTNALTPTSLTVLESQRSTLRTGLDYGR